jgi:hypothetical protein
MVDIILHVEPGVVLDWETFKAEKPPFSIALDGFVYGMTKYCSDGPYANFNHHEEVERLSTRSTCMQIYFSIMMGLFDSFQKDGKPYAHVYVNDADQDVCLAWWLLKNSEQVSLISWDNPLARFIVIEDFLDASAGAFPFNDTDRPDSFLKKQAWIFEPYTTARRNRTLHAMEAKEMQEIIESIGQRITLFAHSQGDFLELDLKPEIIGGGANWKMIIEKDGYTRSSLYVSGTKAFVGMRQRKDGNHTYVIGKMSPFVKFPITDIYHALNQAENLTDDSNRWGGSDIIGGSPRRTGSRLSPKQVEVIINELLVGKDKYIELV